MHYKKRLPIKSKVTMLQTGISPTFQANFLAAGSISLPSWLTHSRASNATMYDSTGKLTFAPNNIVLQSEAVGTAPWSAGTGASVTSTARVPPLGTTAKKMYALATTDWHDYYQLISIPEGSSVIVSAVCKADGYNYAAIGLTCGGSGQLYRIVFDLTTGQQSGYYYGGGGLDADSSGGIDLGDGWWRIYFKINSLPSAATDVTVGMRDTGAAFFAQFAGDGSSGVDFAAIQVERVTYETTPRTYNFTDVAAYYGPRFDFDPSTTPPTPRGLLIEEARTNILVNTQNLTNTSPWTNEAGLTSRALSGTSPDGSSLMTLVTEDTGTSGHYFYGGSPSTALAIQTYTVSAFVKGGTQQYVCIRGEATASATYPWVTINTTTGAVNANTSVVSGSSGSAYVGNGVWRVWFSFANYAVVGAGGWNLVFGGSDVSTAPVPASTLSPTYAGTSKTWSIWGVQLEAGTFPTSYIPNLATSGPGVTRTIDSIVFSGSAATLLKDATKGWVAAEIMMPTDTPGWTPRIIGDTGSAVTLLAAEATRLTFATYNGTNLLSTSTLSYGSSAARGAVTWTTSNRYISGNGTATQTDAFAPGNASTTPSLGRGAGTTAEALNGWVRSLAVGNVTLPSAILQQKSIVGAPY